jgi:hypothetical protein
MKRMDKDGQDKLLAVVDKVASLVEDGDSPDEAIIKIAKEERLPDGHIPVVCHAFNVGRANFLRKTASSLLEKASTVPLANSELILNRLNSKIEKSASMRSKIDSISNDYKEDPKSWLKLYDFAYKKPFMDKAASYMEKQGFHKEDNKELTSLQKEKEIKKASSLLHRFDKELEDAKSQVLITEDLVKSAYTKCCNFLRTNNLDLQQARKDLTLLHGPVSEIMFKHLEATNKKFFQKSANIKTNYSKREDLKVFENCIKAISNYQAAKRNHEKLASSSGPRKLKELMFPSLTKEAADDPSKEKKPSPNKPAPPNPFKVGLGKGYTSTWNTLGTPLVEHSFNDDLNWKAKDDKAMAALTSPEHELDMQHIRTKAMLTDFMANDPVLSEHDPQDVTSAFNEIQRLAPRVARDPSLTRALLRRHLAQGQLDVHELGQLADIEGTIRDNREHPGLERNVPESMLPVSQGTVGRGYGSNIHPGLKKFLASRRSVLSNKPIGKK